MNENKKGYWVYSIFAVIVGFGLFAFWGYLIYDLIIKLSGQDFSDNTILQALISLIVTVFLGGYFSKGLEQRNAKKIEVFKIQRAIALNVVDESTVLYHHPTNIEAKEALIAESVKVKLFFDDQTLSAIDGFLNALDDNEERNRTYVLLSDQLKKAIK